jgi:hypothetical protein
MNGSFDSKAINLAEQESELEDGPRRDLYYLNLHKEELKAIVRNSDSGDPKKNNFNNQRQDHADSGSLNPDSMDFSAMKPLPDYAVFDPTIGAGAGKWIDDFIEYAEAVSPMTPKLFLEGIAYSIVSMVIARRLFIPMAYDYIYSNLYVLLLAPTTLYRKTTALTIAKKLIKDAHLDFLLAAQDTTFEAFVGSLAGSQPINYSNLTPADQKEWEVERNFCSQKGMINDEISGFLAVASKDYNRGTEEMFLRLYDCEGKYTRETQSKGRIVVKNSYLTWLGASTPAAMSVHFKSEKLWASGFWPRFAILTPENRPVWKEALMTDRPAGLENALRELFNRLPNDHKWPDPPKSLSVSISPEAFDTWNKYNKALSSDLLNDNLPQKLWGLYGRLPTQALKVAILLAALDWPAGNPSPTIELQQMVKALLVSESWRASSHRAIAITNESEYNRISERIIKIISTFEPTGASMRDIHRRMQDHEPHDIQAALGDLVTAGSVLENSHTREGQRGRPTIRYTLEKD